MPMPMSVEKPAERGLPMAHEIRISAGAFRALVAAVVAATLYFSTQGSAFAAGQAMLLPVDPIPLVAVTDKGEPAFSIEIAEKPAERSAGLMFRQAMADDHGMLFVFERTQEVIFWMKDTPMPLDLVFIGEDGRIAAIRRGEPESEAVIPSGAPVRFVLELKAGTAQRRGIREGDLIRHPRVDAVHAAPSAN